MTGLTWDTLKWSGGGRGPEPEPSGFPFKLTGQHVVTLGQAMQHVNCIDNNVYTAFPAAYWLRNYDINTGELIQAIPRPSDRPKLSAFWTDVDHDSKVLYLGTRYTSTNLEGQLSGSVEAFDMSDPKALVWLGGITWTMDDGSNPSHVALRPTTIKFYTYGGHKYVAIAGNSWLGGGFGVLNVDDPTNMFLSGALLRYENIADMRPHGVDYLGDGLCVVGNYNSNMRVVIVDATNPSELAIKGYLPTADLPYGKVVWCVKAMNSNLVAGALLAGGTTMAERSGNGLILIDTSDKTAPKVKSITPIPDDDLDVISITDRPPTELIIVERAAKMYALLNNGNKGNAVFDLSDIDDVKYLGNVGPSPSGNSIRTQAFNAALNRFVNADGLNGPSDLTSERSINFYDVSWS